MRSGYIVWIKKCMLMSGVNEGDYIPSKKYLPSKLKGHLTPPLPAS